MLYDLLKNVPLKESNIIDMDQRTRIFVNPTNTQFISLCKKSNDEVRLLIFNNDLYVWSSFNATHMNVIYWLTHSENAWRTTPTAMASLVNDSIILYHIFGDMQTIDKRKEIANEILNNTHFKNAIGKLNPVVKHTAEYNTLTEVASSNVLYHFTSAQGFIRIIKDNTLRVGANGYVSLTRNPNHEFSDVTNVVLILDKNKLTHNYKLTSYRGDNPKIITYFHDINHKKYEQEERIPYNVDNILKYIKAVIITNNNIYMPYNKTEEKELDTLSIELKKKGISVYHMNLKNRMWHTPFSNTNDPETLHESKIIKITNKRDTYVVIENPLPAQISNMLDNSKFHRVRGMIKNNKLYIWDAYYGTHYSVSIELSIPDNNKEEIWKTEFYFDLSPYSPNLMYINFDTGGRSVHVNSTQIMNNIKKIPIYNATIGKLNTKVVKNLNEGKIIKLTLGLKDSNWEGKFKNINVIERPTPQQILNLIKKSQYNTIRWMINGNNWWAWVAEDAIHHSVIMQLINSYNTNFEHWAHVSEFFTGLMSKNGNKYTVEHINGDNIEDDEIKHTLLLLENNNSFKSMVNGINWTFPNYLMAYLKESRIGKVFTKDKEVLIYENPTNQQLYNLIYKFKNLRFLIDDKSLYVWDAALLLHNSFINLWYKDSNNVDIIGEMEFSPNNILVIDAEDMNNSTGILLAHKLNKNKFLHNVIKNTKYELYDKEGAKVGETTNVNEAVEDIPNYWSENQTYKAYINPTPQQLINVLHNSKMNEVRFICTPNKFYMWDSYYAIHNEFADQWERHPKGEILKEPIITGFIGITKKEEIFIHHIYVDDRYNTTENVINKLINNKYFTFAMGKNTFKILSGFNLKRIDYDSATNKFYNPPIEYISEEIKIPNVLYHALDLPHAVHALENNRLEGRMFHRYWPDGKRRQENDPEYKDSFFMKGISLTRDFNFAKDWKGVIFVLNQAKLKQKYKIIPYDWGYHMYSKHRKKEKEEYLITSYFKKKYDNKDDATFNKLMYDDIAFVNNLNDYLLGVYISKSTYDIYKETNDKIKYIMQHPKFKGILPDRKTPVLSAKEKHKFESKLLDVRTPSPETIAKKHNVPLKQILQQLQKGIKVEQEHTTDLKVAREIALDHLNEVPTYYNKLKMVESNDIIISLWYNPNLKKTLLIDDGTHTLAAVEHLQIPQSTDSISDLEDYDVIDAAVKKGWVRVSYITNSKEIVLYGNIDDIHKALPPLQKKYYFDNVLIEISPISTNTLYWLKNEDDIKLFLKYKKLPNSIKKPKSNNIIIENDQQHIDQIFEKLAQQQRGKPESMFLNPFNPGVRNLTGLYTWMLEHTGDLIHRAAQPYAIKGWGFEALDEKSRKLLRVLRQAYGIEREIEGNLKNNYMYDTTENGNTISFDEWKKQALEAGKRYAEAYKKLTPLTNLQKWGRDAAIYLGLFQFKKCQTEIEKIREVVDKGREEFFKEYYTLKQDI